MKLNKDDIASVYSGRPGCCCGCKGKHYRPGDRGAKGMFTRVLRALESADEVDDQGDHVFLDLGSRWYIAYRKDA